MRKKHFLILAFLLFFAPSLHAQKHRVIIPDSVATWYLERNQQLILLEKDVVILREEIANLKYEESVNSTIKQTYLTDSKSYLGKIQVKEEELKSKEKTIKELKAEIRKQVFLKWVGFSLAVLVLIASLLIGHG